jgi:FtsP/CotA-like multicopper oxidase with cupredoxin domain
MAGHEWQTHCSPPYEAMKMGRAQAGWLTGWWLPVALTALATVVGLVAVPSASEGRTREYFVAAEEVVWNFAPTGKSLLHGAGHSNGIPSPWAGHTRRKKARYIEYTDAAFSARRPQPEWLGVLGPIIRAEVGDTVVVHFLNRTRNPASIHPHGLRYTKDHEGAHYPPSGRGGRVRPGDRFTYTWIADEGSGPGPNDASSLVWWYHSHIDEPVETNLGLLGPIIVTAPGRARDDGSPVDVDREVVLLFMIFNENRAASIKAERGLMHAVNGYIFGNLPGLRLRSGEHVRWHLLGMGSEMDLHTVHWHGKTLRFRGRNTDVIELLPGSMASADMVADNPGTWLIHCHVGDHLQAGMLATYTIAPAEAAGPGSR